MDLSFHGLFIKQFVIARKSNWFAVTFAVCELEIDSQLHFYVNYNVEETEEDCMELAEQKKQ